MSPIFRGFFVCILPRLVYSIVEVFMLKFIKNDETNRRNAIYECVCGTVKSIRKSAVNSGSTKSCGCYRKQTAIQNGKAVTTHGMTNTYLYRKWADLKRKNKLSTKFEDFSKFYNFFKGKENLGFIIKDGFSIISEQSVLFVPKQEAKQLKRKQTCLKKYGVDAASKSKEVKAKIKNRQIKKYGDHPSRTSDIKEKIRQTILKKYGVDHFMKLAKYKTAAKNKYAIYNGESTSDISNRLEISQSWAQQLIKNYGYEYIIQYSKHFTVIETIIKNILDEIDIKYVFGTKIANKNTDFLIEDHKLIIECDGLYWHSDAINPDNRYHIHKRLLYKEYGYRSLFFREDEIENKPHIVKSIILNCLQKSNKIYARQCKIVNLTKQQSKEFFSNNHLMGCGKGEAVALEYNGEIISAIQITNRSKYIDISRFCCKNQMSVVGGFSKLLNYINNKFNKDISTFIDLRYGSGEYLPALGFEKASEHISFRWTKNNRSCHRMIFRGNSGYEHGYYKIWDCGQARYIKKVPCGT